MAMLNLFFAAAARSLGRRWLAAAAAIVISVASGLPAAAQSTIKVGVLHSLSGTMAISETTLKDLILMLVDEQNKRGGLLGKKLEAVVVDPASNWPLFAEKARELLSKDRVAAVFGTWTSVSRKSVLPVFKELDGILFYPVQYEGEESERNVFYTGAAPNQQAIPAVDYLMKEEKVQRWVLEGTDYVYPRTTNKILVSYLKSKGVRDEDISIDYTPFGHSDWQARVAAIKRFGSAGKKTAVVSTINGDANVPFYKELANQGIRASEIPVLALSIGEEELAGIDTKPLVGHLAVWNYFQSIDTPANKEFIAKWRAFVRNPKRTTNDPMEAHAIGFSMWVKAVQKAGTIDPDKVIDALPGIQVPNLTGGVAEMLPDHHITKPAFIGEVRADGQFNVVWKTDGLIPGAAWSPYLDGSKDLLADWVKLKCGNYNTVTQRCGAPAFAVNPPVAPAREQITIAVPTPTPPRADLAATAKPVDPVSSAAVGLPPPGRRIALVIGNSGYKNVQALANAQRDATTVADALRRIGFQAVSLQIDLGKEKLVETLRLFAREAETSDWALIYFAGHGIEMNGTNYLIPVDAKLETDRDVTFETVPLDQVMNAVEGAKQLRLVLLDACRDNPFTKQMRRSVASRSIVGRGLARIEPDAGTVVVYAAKHGETALDGEGANSPFVSAFVKEVVTPGVELRKLFDLVRDDVMEATNNRQQPFTYGSVPGRQDFFFVARK
jgi:urea transport system substrate-binding protein